MKELDNVVVFILIEPGAMAFADVDDHAGAAGEIGAMHERGADRARDVTDFEIGFVLAGDEGIAGRAEDDGLLLAVDADFFEGGDFNPEAVAAGAFADFAAADLLVFEICFAMRAGEIGFLAGVEVNRCAAMGAVFGALKDHPETGGTGDSGEAGAAMGAIRGVAPAGSATHQTIQGRCMHEKAGEIIGEKVDLPKNFFAKKRPSYGLGMRRVALIMALPLRTKMRENGWKIRLRRVNWPSQKSGPVAPVAKRRARMMTMMMEEGMGVPSKYFTLPVAVSARVVEVTLKRARRLMPQQTK